MDRTVVSALALVLLTACGTEAATEGSEPSGGVASEEVRACALLDLTAATQVLGAGTEHPGGDTEAGTCVYVNPGVAMLTIQLGSGDLYDRITIMPPHTPVSIGDEGRHNVQENGAAAVQFRQGDHSVTVSVQPIGEDPGYLEAVISAARNAATRLP